MAKNKSTVSPRWAKFCGWLLKRLGWTSDGGPMVEKKAIVLGVPHTTIWDFLSATCSTPSSARRPAS